MANCGVASSAMPLILPGPLQSAACKYTFPNSRFKAAGCLVWFFASKSRNSGKKCHSSNGAQNGHSRTSELAEMDGRR
jgi:hypothetical protein